MESYNMPFIFTLLMIFTCTDSKYLKFKPLKDTRYNEALEEGRPSEVTVALGTKIIHRTSDRYLSVAVDSSIIRERKKWAAFNITSPRLQTLSAALGPAYLRIGGTEADFVIFKPDSKDDYANQHTPVTFDDPYNGQFGQPKNLTNFTMSAKYWDELNEYAVRNNFRMLFDLNVLLRTGQDWDYTNAAQLLKYTLDKSYAYNIDWELGNEPDAFRHALNRTLDATQLGVDFVTLDSLLKYNRTFSPTFGKSAIVGPDLTRPKKRALQYLDEFLQVAGSSLNAITWHHYYVNGRIATQADFTNATVLNSLRGTIKAMKDQIRDSGFSETPLWLGETSSAWGGGAPGLSNTYAAGFMWLDKLGTAAETGHDVIVRQTLFGGHYSLLDMTLDPNPDYWLSVLYKRLVGTSVIGVTVTGGGDDVRFYAACQRSSRVSSNKGNAVLYGMNLGHHGVNINLGAPYTAFPKDVFILTPHGKHNLTSSHVNLNGEKLKMTDNKTLPKLLPVQVEGNTPIKMKPFSMVFIEVPGVAVC